MSVLAGAGPLALGWVAFLVIASVFLFAAGWVVLRRLAARHGSDDGNANGKVIAAVAASVLLGAGGLWSFTTLQAAGVDGIHDNFMDHLQTAIGENDYNSSVQTIPNKITALGIQSTNLILSNNSLADMRAQGISETSKEYTKLLGSRDALVASYIQTKKDLAAAELTKLTLAPNHYVWVKVQPMLAAGDDEQVRHLLVLTNDPTTVTEVVPLELACARDQAGLCVQPLQPAALAHDYKDAHQVLVSYDKGIEEAYHLQESSRAQMNDQLLLLGFPMVPGLLMAPFAFAGGSILNRAFTESSSVGYKMYPGKAMGFFLLLGGMFLFAVPFAAWMLRDLSRRSREGQIAL